MDTNSLALLYHSPNMLLNNAEMKINILNLMSFFINDSISALEKFYLEKDLICFDPHVGETSCQIRAYQLYLMCQNGDSDLKKVLIEIGELKKSLAIVMDNIKVLNNQYDSKSCSKRKEISMCENLEDFLAKRQLLFRISANTIYLAKSLFLTKFKCTDLKGNTYINYDYISKKLLISKKLAKKIVHHFQNYISIKSVEFIERILLQIPYAKEISLIFHFLIKSDDDGRMVLPCYIGMKILLTHMYSKNCPILIISERVWCESTYSDVVIFLYSPSKGIAIYNISGSIPYELLNETCVVIHGSVVYTNLSYLESQSRYIERFLESDLCEIVLGYMANHPQYSGIKLNTISNNPYSVLINEFWPLIASCFNNKLMDKVLFQLISKFFVIRKIEAEFLAMKELGIKKGCSGSNPSLFHIKHIYCNTIGQEIKRINTIFYRNNEVNNNFCINSSNYIQRVERANAL